LQTAAGLPAVAAVDDELDTVRAGPGEAVLSAAATTGTATVVSAHDFEGTPSREAMVETLEAACEYGTVGKLAVTAGNLDDAFSVLDVTRTLARAGKTVATMAMGEAGRHTRAVAPVYGSRVGYAPVDPTAATAPGQYDLLTLSELVDRLGGRRSA
jgi:3-dehydroquinate dehydratase-1